MECLFDTAPLRGEEAGKVMLHFLAWLKSSESPCTESSLYHNSLAFVTCRSLQEVQVRCKVPIPSVCFGKARSVLASPVSCDTLIYGKASGVLTELCTVCHHGRQCWNFYLDVFLEHNNFPYTTIVNPFSSTLSKMGFNKKLFYFICMDILPICVSVY